MSLEWAERVRDLRARLGLNQHELANVFNIDHAQVSQWETAVLEPTLCWQRLLQFLNDCTSSALQFFERRPWTEGATSWSEKVEGVLRALDWNQSQLASFLGIHRHSVYAWLNDREIGDPCYQILVSLLEFYSGVDVKEWPAGLHVEAKDVVSAERVKLLRLSLALTQQNFGNILHVGGNTASRWETGQRAPDWSSNILIRVMETYPRSVDLIEKVPWTDERISQKRAREIRNFLGMTRLELAKLLGTSEHRITFYEQDGVDPAPATLIYTLLEQHSDDFIPLIENLSNPGGQACPIW